MMAFKLITNMSLLCARWVCRSFRLLCETGESNKAVFGRDELRRQLGLYPKAIAALAVYGSFGTM